MSINDFTSHNRSAHADPADLAAVSQGVSASGFASAPVLESTEIRGLPEEDGSAASGEPAQPAIRAELARRITFASHQCDVPVIVSLAISNPTDEDFEDLELHLTAEPEVLGERTWTVDRIPAPGTSYGSPTVG